MPVTSTKNSLKEIIAFFNDPKHPLKEGEFAEFWKACSEEERDEFRRADLKA